MAACFTSSLAGTALQANVVSRRPAASRGSVVNVRAAASSAGRNLWAPGADIQSDLEWQGLVRCRAEAGIGDGKLVQLCSCPPCASTALWQYLCVLIRTRCSIKTAPERPRVTCRSTGCVPRRCGGTAVPGRHACRRLWLGPARLWRQRDRTPLVRPLSSSLR